MKTKLNLVVIMLVICSAFSTVKNTGLELTYGVADNNPAQIKLSLQKDYTFTYQDLSDKSQIIQVNGTYQMKQNKIYLEAEQDIEFHSKWKISEDLTTAKSRKGITFYTLRKK